MAQFRFTASVRGAGKRGRKMREGGVRIQRQLEDMLHREAREAEKMFRFWAPRESGTLRESLESDVDTSNVARPRFTISYDPGKLEAHAGYDYLPVTRFGHRGTITPVDGRALALEGPNVQVNTAAHREPASMRSSVPGYDPVNDWAADAAEFVDQRIDKASDRFARRIESSFR